MKTKLILIAFTALLLLNMCKPLEKTTYVDRWRETVKIDSFYMFLQDTMYLETKGDTVFVYRIKVRIDYKYKFLNKTDSFKILVKEYRTITKKIPVEKIRWYGYFDIFLLAIAVIYLIYRLYKKFRI